ncbi:MAG: CsgG/HfaB family protein [Candidatus Neomarinimicrobiota bacterium]
MAKTYARIAAATGLALVLASCAATSAPSALEAELVTEEQPAVSLSMPPGWDDAIIDRIKAGEGLKKRVAVLDFEGAEKLAGKVDLKLADLLITSLVRSGRFDVIERTRMHQVLSEQDLGLTGIMDESTAAQMGKVLGAEYVVLGAITSATQQSIDKFGYILVVIEVGLDVRAVDATSGKILLSQHAVGRSENKVVVTSEGTVVSGAIDYASTYAQASKDAIQGIGAKIGDLFPLLGYVVLADETQVITDIGEDRGMSIGDNLIVFRITGEITHPATGEHIGWNKEVLAAITIRTTEKNLSTGQITFKKGDSTTIQAGDLVISASQ